MRKLILIFFLWVGAMSYSECVDFYYVKRPVAYGTVYHEYIAALNHETGHSEALGLLKGEDDRKAFDASVSLARPDEGPAKLSFLGSACDENAQRALSLARGYAKEWDSFYDNTLLFYARMGVTPLIGKPCRNVALEISNRLIDFLH